MKTVSSAQRCRVKARGRKENKVSSLDSSHVYYIVLDVLPGGSVLAELQQTGAGSRYEVGVREHNALQ